MKYILTVAFFFTFYIANAQVKLLTLNELDKRIASGKDTVYVVNFWATWCGPCVTELPNFERLNQYQAKGPLKVLLVSLDFKSKLKSAVVPFVNKNKIKSEVFVINEADQQAYIDRVDPRWSGSIPATLFLKNNGKIRVFKEKEFTYSELVEAVNQLE